MISRRSWRRREDDEVHVAEATGAEDFAAVRGPARVDEFSRRIRELLDAGAVAVHHEKLEAIVDPTRENDAATVVRPGRPAVERGLAGDVAITGAAGVHDEQLGDLAADGNESDLLPIGRPGGRVVLIVAEGELTHVAAVRFRVGLEEMDFHAAVPAGDEHDLPAIGRPEWLVIHRPGEGREFLDREIFGARHRRGAAQKQEEDEARKHCWERAGILMMHRIAGDGETALERPTRRGMMRTRNAPRLLPARCIVGIEIGAQAAGLSFMPLHSVLNVAYCSGVRMDLASCMYLFSVAFEQPSL